MGRIASVSRPKSLSRTAAGDWDPYEETWDEHRAGQEPDEPLPSETDEYWSPPHLYHGTAEDLKPGDSVEPGHGPNFGGGQSMDPRHTHAYATPHIRSAWEYAENAAARRGGRPRVYEVGRTEDMLPDPESGHAVGGPQMIPHPGWRSKTGFPVLRELEPHELGDYTAAAHWAPSSGIFAPTTGLDRRLFDGREHLRPVARGAIMEKLDRCLRTDTGLTGSDWQDWLKVYLAGGSASEWAGDRPNEAAQDLDVLLGVDYAGARRNTPGFREMTDAEIDAALNTGLRRCFNTDGWSPDGFEGTWNLTGYVNPQAWDIRSIKPYAAWDLSDSRWAVRPPHLPDHALADFNPAVLAEARAIASQARAILRLPEALRIREARALWDRIHDSRRSAFSEEGEGWTDPGNVIEKWLAYAPGNLLGQIRELALAKTAGLVQPRPEDFAHGVYNNDTSDFRLHGDDYILHHSHPKVITAYVRGPELVAPDQPNYTRGHQRPYEVGYLSWLGGDTPKIYKTFVKEDHRRKGVASAMLGFAREIEPSLQHSHALTEDGHAWAEKTAAHVPGDEPVVRTHMDLGWSPDEWADARRDPWHASAKLAQAEVRHSHPKLRMPLPRGEEGDAMVGHLLRYAGYQGPTEGAFAARHPDPSKMTSNPSWLNGKPGVALHPDRWDYGTAAHEAAHHVVMYNHAVARNEPQTDEQVHGPEWARAYGQALNKISKHAGDDFVYHHGRFRSMIDEGLQYVRPGDLDDAEKRLPPRRWVDDEVYPAPTRLASALEPRAGAATRVGVTGYDGLTKRSGMIYLDLPEGAVRRLPGGVDDHHITVVYLGKNVTDEAFEEACRRARLAAGKTGPLHGFLNGTETFEPSDSSGEKVPVFVPAYIPGIGALRRELEDLSGSEHRQYRPHVTLAYLEPEDDLPAPHPKVDVSFGRLHVKRGDQVVSFPLGHSQWG